MMNVYINFIFYKGIEDECIDERLDEHIDEGRRR